jgi:hypothetical protein
MPAKQFVKVVIIIDSFGPLSGYMIVIGNPPAPPQFIALTSASRVTAGDALQKFILNFGSQDSPALSKSALTAYATLVFIGLGIFALRLFHLSALTTSHHYTHTL